MKACTKCKEVKELSAFNKRSTTKDGHKSGCRECVKKYYLANKESINEKGRAYHKANKEKGNRASRAYAKANPERIQDNGLRYKYGITLAERNAIAEDQGHRCKICKIEEKHAPKSTLCVDHDHNTGAIRGLLCFKCNSAIGLLQDNLEFVESAATYLKENGK